MLHDDPPFGFPSLSGGLHTDLTKYAPGYTHKDALVGLSILLTHVGLVRARFGPKQSFRDYTNALLFDVVFSRLSGYPTFTPRALLRYYAIVTLGSDIVMRLCDSESFIAFCVVRTIIVRYY